MFHVADGCPSRYADRPRLISTLSTAITDCREIDVTTRAESGALSGQRLKPLRLVIEPPRVRLLALRSSADADPPVLIDLDRIETVATRDDTFTRPDIEAAATILQAVRRP